MGNKSVDGRISEKDVEEIRHAVFKHYSSICLDRMSLKNLSKKCHIHQARKPMKSCDKPSAVDKTSNWDLDFIFSDPDPSRKT